MDEPTSTPPTMVVETYLLERLLDPHASPEQHHAARRALLASLDPQRAVSAFIRGHRGNEHVVLPEGGMCGRLSLDDRRACVKPFRHPEPCSLDG